MKREERREQPPKAVTRVGHGDGGQGNEYPPTCEQSSGLLIMPSLLLSERWSINMVDEMCPCMHTISHASMSCHGPSPSQRRVIVGRSAASWTPATQVTQAAAISQTWAGPLSYESL